MEIALAECRKLGLTLMLYDEGGWPSGGVLDRLIARYPECRGRFLVKDEQGKIQEKRADFPDLLDKKTTEHFIEMTHELYRKHFGREFGKTIKGIFTDEPFFQMVSDENQIFYTPAMDELAENAVKMLKAWCESSKQLATATVCGEIIERRSLPENA